MVSLKMGVEDIEEILTDNLNGRLTDDSFMVSPNHLDVSEIVELGEKLMHCYMPGNYYVSVAVALDYSRFECYRVKIQLKFFTPADEVWWQLKYG